MDDRPPLPGAKVRALHAWMRSAVQRLLEAGFDQAATEVEILVESVLGLRRHDLHLRDRELAPAEREALERLLEARLEGIPIQYLTQRVAFRNIDLAVGPGVFVPRPETEGLVSLVLTHFESVPAGQEVLDLCLGSGAILLSILAERPDCRGVGVEMSRLALDYARKNAAALGLEGRSLLLEGDLYGPLDRETGAGRFQVITANPPYIPERVWDTLPRDVRDFEPRLSLLGGTDGLEVIRRIVAGAPDFLAPGGLLAIELDVTHGAAFSALVQEAGDFEKADVRPDLAGRVRYGLARTRRRSRSMRDGRRQTDT